MPRWSVDQLKVVAPWWHRGMGQVVKGEEVEESLPILRT